MYMYPIKINREPQRVSYDHKHQLNDIILSLDDLRKYVSEDETFQIDGRMIYVYGLRMETAKETESRVKREESYMKKYNEYHSKK